MTNRMTGVISSVLRTNNVAVVNIDPSGKQGMINWKNCKTIPPGRKMAEAICDYSHKWTIYLSGLCIDQFGTRYYEPIEISTHGVYKAEHLTGVIEQTYKDLIATCDPQHLVASGWIAVPYAIELSEEQASAVFEAVGAWDQPETGQPKHGE